MQNWLHHPENVILINSVIFLFFGKGNVVSDEEVIWILSRSPPPPRPQMALTPRPLSVRCSAPIWGYTGKMKGWNFKGFWLKSATAVHLFVCTPGPTRGPTRQKIVLGNRFIPNQWQLRASSLYIITAHFTSYYFTTSYFARSYASQLFEVSCFLDG